MSFPTLKVYLKKNIFVILKFVFKLFTFQFWKIKKSLIIQTKQIPPQQTQMKLSKNDEQQTAIAVPNEMPCNTDNMNVHFYNY